MIDLEELKKELFFQTSRSGGKGGQNVNKVESKVGVVWYPQQSRIISLEQKARLLLKFGKLLQKDGALCFQCSETRSQLENKQIVTIRLLSIINDALKKDKTRVAHKIPKSAIEQRLNDKKMKAEKKSFRKSFEL